MPVSLEVVLLVFCFSGHGDVRPPLHLLSLAGALSRAYFCR